MRKIIQIAVSSAPNESDILYALCEDGTLWSVMSGRDDWVQQHPVPDMPLTVGSYRFTHDEQSED